MAFLCALAVKAEDKVKPVMTVDQFTVVGQIPNSYAVALRSNVIAAVNQAGRVQVIDNTNQQVLDKEAERRTSEAAMADAGRVGEMGTLMANFIMTGDVTSLNTERVVNKKTGDSYISAEVNFVLKVLNPNNGTVIGQKSFSNTGTGSSADDAAAAATKDLPATAIKNFILNTFKVQGAVIAIDEQDGDKAKTVYMNLGSSDGIQKGQVVLVFKEVDVAGEKSRKQIGEVKVLEVMSASRSLCKVSSGGDLIVQCFEGKIPMPVETKEKKTSIFSDILR